MINTGLGETQINSLLAALNIPGLSQRHLKKREREIGEKIAEFAQETCDDALDEETEL